MGKQEESKFWEPYSAHARVVRLWFMTYGIGVPAALMANNELRKAITSSVNFKLIICLYLVGVVIQVVLGIAYKHAMSYLYVVESESHNDDKMHEILCAFTNKVWPDLAADVISLGLFAWATAVLIKSL